MTPKQPDPRFNKDDHATGIAHTASGDMPFSCVVLQSVWNGYRYTYLVEEVQDGCTLLVDESNLIQE